MAKKYNTLNDLDAFLKDREEEHVADTDFMEADPKTLVDVDRLEGQEVEGEAEQREISTEELAQYIHQLAEQNNVNFADIWMDVLVEGIKINPLLHVEKIIKTLWKLNWMPLRLIGGQITYLSKSSEE